MFFKYIKLISLSLIFITFVIFFIISKKTICDNKYWENTKSTRKIENIKICIKEGNTEAAVLLSKMYANGDIVQKNHDEAIEIIERFAESGNSNAMIQIGDLYSSYQNKFLDFEKAEEWYKKAINSSDNYSEQAKISLAHFYMRKYFSTRDQKYVNQYINWLKKIANEGNTEAMNLLAREYQEGTYISKDYHIGLEWLKKAALKSDVLAHRTIGNYYANGFLGDANYNEAKYWFQKATKMGDDISAKFLEDNPVPLGLEITKATISDFQKKFTKHTQLDFPNFINGGYTYLVDQKYINLDGVKGSVNFVFNKNSILESVLMVIDKSQCKELQSHLQSKYLPMLEVSSMNFFSQGLTVIELTGEYVFYSPTFTKKYITNVCTLIYRSRAFSVKLFETEQFIRRQKEINIKKKMEGF
jgi:tetratricopeptide (TPR) repeat protein